LRKHAYFILKERGEKIMAYTRGNSSQIIVGAAALFTYDPQTPGADSFLTDANLPSLVEDVSFKETLSDSELGADFRNVGYTSNGLELDFNPDFGEVKVDQMLDVAKLYKQGMKVNLKTTFAEATLENLLFSLAGKATDLDIAANGTKFAGNDVLNLSAGDIGECPVERGLVAVGPGTGDCKAGNAIERIYVAYKALSIETVNVSAKRDAATEFAVSFRLLPNNSASYGKIVDRTISLVS
jgi:hypothetical protein